MGRRLGRGFAAGLGLKHLLPVTELRRGVDQPPNCTSHWRRVGGPPCGTAALGCGIQRITPEGGRATWLGAPSPVRSLYGKRLDRPDGKGRVRGHLGDVEIYEPD